MGASWGLGAGLSLGHAHPGVVGKLLVRGEIVPVSVVRCRQLDGCPATIDALPGVVAAVAGRCPVLFDGGVRRGTDVLKALALGAAAVLVGRPILWGLAAGGQAGAERVLEMLRGELDLAMALAGAPTVAEITRDLVRRSPAPSTNS